MFEKLHSRVDLLHLSLVISIDYMLHFKDYILNNLGHSFEVQFCLLHGLLIGLAR